MSDIEDFLHLVASWAHMPPSLQAVILIGSHATGTATAESDVDLVLITTDPAALISNDAWLARFGKIMSITEENWGLVHSRRVRYENGTEVEYGITTPAWLSTDPFEKATADILKSGHRIIHDPHDLIGSFLKKAA